MRKKAALGGAAVLALLLAVLALVGTPPERTAIQAETVPPKGQTVEELLDKEEVPVWSEGRAYRRNPDVSAYLLIGVDQEGEAQSSEHFSGQADALLLLVVDQGQERFRVLQINRDTIAEVEVLDAQGEVLERQPISLAYSHGDGLESSCENTVRAVSRLLYGLELDGYAAVWLDALPILNDLAGGVTVTVEDDFPDPALVQGAEVTLQGEQALRFVRTLHGVGDGSNLARMARHRAYLQGFAGAMKRGMDEDPELILKMYDAAAPYLVTSIGSGTASRIARQCRDYENGGAVMVEGEVRQGETYVEFYPDKDALRQTVLDLFYSQLPEDS